MLNMVALVGRLTKDPELRYTQSGKAVTQMRIAVDRGTTDAEGNKETDFVNIVVWNKSAEACRNYLEKGSLIAVKGRLQTRQYETQDGQKRERVEVVADPFNGVTFLSNKKNANGGRQEPGSMGETLEINDDDDVPF